MEPSFGPQQIWINKLLLYTTLFHVFILWLYAAYNIYLHFTKSSLYLHGSHLIYSLFTLFVSIMFSWFMIHGISSFSRYHLRYAILSITLMTLYILWWYLYPLVEDLTERLNDPFIEIIIWINFVLCFEYYVVYIRYVFHQNATFTLSTNATNHKKKKRHHPRTYDIYQSCIPTLLFDNQVCTLYFATCIYQFLIDQDPIECIVFSLICVLIQWIIVCVGYRVMNHKDPKCSICLLIAYWMLFFLGYSPYCTAYKSLHVLMFGQFILLPFLVFITRMCSIYWLYQSYKHFRQRTQHKKDKNADKPNAIDSDHPVVYQHPNGNKSDSSDAHKHYIPPIQTIKQLSGVSTTSCKESPNLCRSKHNNISHLIQLCSEFGDTDAKPTKYAQFANSTIDTKFNELYENEGECVMEQSPVSSPRETLLEQCWNHYMQFHQSTDRHKTCSLSHQCPWSEHMRKHKDDKDYKHRLLTFCVNHKQLYHVYFYHSVDYDLISRDERRMERYIEHSDDLNPIKHNISINRASSTAMTDFGEDNEEETSNHSDDACMPEPGTHFNDESLCSNDDAMNIEMTTMNECMDDEDHNDEKCPMVQKILDYGSAVNCNEPDLKYQASRSDGPEMTRHKEEDELIQLYLHCITNHSEYKRRCEDCALCGFREWKHDPQQTMRQMIHSEFYRHSDGTGGLAIVIGNADTNHELDETPVPHPPNDDEYETSRREEEEESKYDNKEFAALKPIVYIPTMMEILKSKTKSQSHYDEMNTEYILQFGHPFTAKTAKFQNPKEEILQNDFKKIRACDWNDLLKKCVGLNNTIRAKHNKLSLRQLVALKLYTDFDDLQRELRKCFRKGSDQEERQKQFYHWNDLLENACNQSNDIITSRIYHGVNKPLMPSSFSGTYYGPISTTTMFDIAKQFAGSNGRILELYPSFSKRGLRVSWLSNFPDEDEVLYMNASFQIVNIYSNEQTTNLYISPFDDPIIYEYYTDEEETMSSSVTTGAGTKQQPQQPTKTMVDDMSSFGDEEKRGMRTRNNNTVAAAIAKHKTLFFERAIMKAIQMINVDSYIISFNSVEMNQNSHHHLDILDAGFGKLAPDEQIAVLYLLYLQYKKNEWREFVNCAPLHVSMAIARYRDQFITLANNVQAVKMEGASSLILQFFAKVHEKTYQFPRWPGPGAAADSMIHYKADGAHASVADLRHVFNILLNGHTTAEEDIKEKENNENNNENNNFINLSTFCKLFPNCKQVKINGNNFDWSLEGMIGFLSKYNLNYSRIALQDIYIRFSAADESKSNSNSNYDDMDYCERLAKRRIREVKLSASKLDKLLKLGWQFVNGTRCHLHRYGFTPHPELPFLSLFANINMSQYEDGIRGRKSHVNKWAMKDILSVSYSSRFALLSKSKKANKSKSKSLFESKTSRNSRNSTLYPSHVLGSTYSSDLHSNINNRDQMEGGNAWSRTSSCTHTKYKMVEGCYITIVPYNSKVCDLSCNVFDKHSLEHQSEIVTLLQWIRSRIRMDGSAQSDTDSDSNVDLDRCHVFLNLCRKIERLVLDPMPHELKAIFIEKSNTKLQREIISFESIVQIFPNVQDVFIRETRFSLRIWYNLLKSIKKHEARKRNITRGPGNGNAVNAYAHAYHPWKLSRVFFSKRYFVNERDLKTMHLRFKPHGWKFEPNEQVIFTKLSQ